MSKFNKGYSQVECNKKLKEREVGIYRIVCNKSLKRAFGAASEGILYIGKSVRLLDRFNHFWACAEGRTKNGHSGGVKFKKRLYNERGIILSGVKIQWIILASDKKAREAEKNELLEYSLKFGEFPPLNSSN